jgi:hypothetical protein
VSENKIVILVDLLSSIFNVERAQNWPFPAILKMEQQDILDLVLTVVFLILTNPSTYQKYDTYSIHNKSVSKLFKESFNQLFYGRLHDNYLLFSVTKTNNQYNLGFGGIWIEFPSYFQSLSGLYLIVIVIGFVINLFATQSVRVNKSSCTGPGIIIDCHGRL